MSPRNPFRTVLLVLVGLAVASGVAAAQTRVVGMVSDVDTGRPLPGAQVHIEGTNIGDVSDENGRYFLDNVGAGMRSVTAQHLGYEKTTVDLLIPAGQTITVDFPMWSLVIEDDEWGMIDRSEDLSGRVTERATGVPLASAVITALPEGTSVKTNRLGRYWLPLDEKPERVQASLPCFGTQTIDIGAAEDKRLDITLDVDPATAPKNVECKPPPSCTECFSSLEPGWKRFHRPDFFGRVTDAETGEPVKGVRIRVHKTGYEYHVDRAKRAEVTSGTDDEGHYALDAPHGSIVLEFKSRCHLTVRMPFFHDGATRRIDVAMPFYHPTFRRSDGHRRGCERTATGSRNLLLHYKAIDRAPPE